LHRWLRLNAIGVNTEHKLIIVTKQLTRVEHTLAWCIAFAPKISSDQRAIGSSMASEDLGKAPAEDFNIIAEACGVVLKSSLQMN
jgi:hypothetical protein